MASIPVNVLVPPAPARAKPNWETYFSDPPRPAAPTAGAAKPAPCAAISKPPRVGVKRPLSPTGRSSDDSGTFGRPPPLPPRKAPALAVTAAAARRVVAKPAPRARATTSGAPPAAVPSAARGVPAPAARHTAPPAKQALPREARGAAAAVVEPDSDEAQLAASLRIVQASRFYKGVDAASCSAVLQQIVDRACPIAFADIAGLSECKRILHEAIILPAKCPQLFTGLRRPCASLLLFGSPGNGKTMLAKAIARECGTTFFNISASAITSKWVGESEKMVRALFCVARALAPSTVFIDEIDSLLQARGAGSEGEGSRRLKTEFLVQIDGAGNDAGDARVLVMGATNRPFDLDDAVIRRFAKRVLVPLPDAAAREALIVSLLSRGDTPHLLGPADWRRCAAATELYSGSDLHQLCAQVAMAPLRDLVADTVRRGEDLGADVPTHALRKITASDVLSAIKERNPSCSPAQLQRLVQWDREFGSK